MVQKTEAVLKNAVSHIKAGRAAKARPALVALLRREPENPQAWYLLSYTLDDPLRQEYALIQALRIKPDFERASTRLAKLRGETVAPAETTSTKPKTGPLPSPSAPAAPPFVPEAEKPAEKAAASVAALRSEDNPPPNRRSRLPMILLSIIVLALLVVAAWWFLPSLTLGPATETPVASRTLPPTWTPGPPTATPSRTRTPRPTPTPTLEPSVTATGPGSSVR